MCIRDRPDSVLPNLGGQMGLNLSMALARSGYLDRTGIRLLACKPETLDRAEDRELFKDCLLYTSGLCDVNQTVSITENFDGVSIDHLKTLPASVKSVSYTHLDVYKRQTEAQERTTEALAVKML